MALVRNFFFSSRKVEGETSATVSASGSGTGSGGSGNLYLNDLIDVSNISPINGHFLIYDSSALKWRNVSQPTSNWTAAYNDKINSASFAEVSGTETLTLTQQDGGTVTASFDNTYLTGGSFSGGDLILNRTFGGSVVIDLDGRYQLLSEKGQANGYTPLDSSGLIPQAYLPPVTITETFVVASESAQLALVAQQGDVAVRTDLNKSFILQGTDPSVLGDWQELLSPTDAVQSVNGLAGAVTLNLGYNSSNGDLSITGGNTINNIAARNVDNNFSVGQTIRGKLTLSQTTAETVIADFDSGQGLGRQVRFPYQFGIGSLGTGYPEIGYNFGIQNSAYTKIVTDTSWRITFGVNNRMSFSYSPTSTGGSAVSWTDVAFFNNLGQFTVNNSIAATSFVKSGGTSSQFLKADGSVDSNAYITASSTDTLTNKSGNISQWTNDAGYLTSFSETDTLDSVTDRGATTTNAITVGGATVNGQTYFNDGSFWDSGFNTITYNGSAFFIRGGSARELQLGANNVNGAIVIDTSNNTTINGTLALSASASALATFSTSSNTLFNTYTANSVTVGYIGNGSGIITGGGNTNFGIRAENDLLFASGGNNQQMQLDASGNLTVSSLSGGGSALIQADASGLLSRSSVDLSNLAYTNVNNNFSTGQTINGTTNFNDASFWDSGVNTITYNASSFFVRGGTGRALNLGANNTNDAIVIDTSNNTTMNGELNIAQPAGSVHLKIAGSDALTWSGNDLRFGGITPSQWTSVSLYTSGSSALTVASGGNLTMNKSTANSVVANLALGAFDGRQVGLPHRFMVGGIGGGYPEIGYNFYTQNSTYTKIATDTAWGITFGVSSRMSFNYAPSGSGTFGWTSLGYFDTSGNLTVTGTITASGGNSTQWNTAYARSLDSNPTFNTSTGVLTFSAQDSGNDRTVDLDGRYVESSANSSIGGTVVGMSEPTTTRLRSNVITLGTGTYVVRCTFYLENTAGTTGDAAFNIYFSKSSTTPDFNNVMPQLMQRVETFSVSTIDYIPVTVEITVNTTSSGATNYYLWIVSTSTNFQPKDSCPQEDYLTVLNPSYVQVVGTISV